MLGMKMWRKSVNVQLLKLFGSMPAPDSGDGEPHRYRIAAGECIQEFGWIRGPARHDTS
jgi:hypothetical protein